MHTLNLRLPDAGATERLGAALADALPGAADDYLAVYLRGELGAGKTTCVRGLLRALGVTGTIRSPTYTLVETYNTGQVACVHVDLYRLRGEADLDALGLRDYLAAGHLILIEWPEHAAGALPAADVDIAFDDADQGRRASVHGGSATGRNWIANLARDSKITSYLPNLT